VTPRFLGHVDLHRTDVLAAPHCVEQAVGESQHVQVLGDFLTEEVIDPVDLRLLEYGVHDDVELAERARRSAERLLVDDARTRGEVVRAECLGQFAERDGRHREVVHERVRAELLLRLGDHLDQAAWIARLEAAARETQPRAELRPRTLVGMRAEPGQHVVDMTLEILVRDVAAAVADEPPVLRQQTPLRKTEEGRQHHPLGQVSGRAEQHEDDRSRLLARRRPSRMRHANHPKARREGTAEIRRCPETARFGRPRR
jgi:hypothetical protein